MNPSAIRNLKVLKEKGPFYSKIMGSFIDRILDQVLLSKNRRNLRKLAPLPKGRLVHHFNADSYPGWFKKQIPTLLSSLERVSEYLPVICNQAI
jgi:hypothetical protein